MFDELDEHSLPPSAIVDSGSNDSGSNDSVDGEAGMDAGKGSSSGQAENRVHEICPCTGPCNAKENTCFVSCRAQKASDLEWPPNLLEKGFDSSRCTKDELKKSRYSQGSIWQMRRWKRSCTSEETKQLTSLLGEDFDVCQSLFKRAHKWASKKTKQARQFLKGDQGLVGEQSYAYIEIQEQEVARSGLEVHALRGGDQQQESGSHKDNTVTAQDVKKSGNQEAPGDDVVGKKCGGKCYGPWSPPTCNDVCRKISEGSNDYFQYSVLEECGSS